MQVRINAYLFRTFGEMLFFRVQILFNICIYLTLFQLHHRVGNIDINVYLCSRHANESKTPKPQEMYESLIK